MKSTKNDHTSLAARLIPTDSWLSSREVKQALGISGCELMHRRLAGEFPFKKVGNSYFYKLPKDAL